MYMYMYMYIDKNLYRLGQHTDLACVTKLKQIAGP